MAEIGMELKLLRVRKGMRQSDVSRETGVPQCVISRIENGKAEENREAAEVLRKWYERERTQQ